MNIECQDGSSQQISQDDSLAQVLGKEHSGRVRGVGFGSSITQIFGYTAHRFSGISLTPPIQTNVDGMKLELEVEKFKVQKLESELENERLRRQAFEGAITRYLLQQGGDFPAELAAMASDERSEQISLGARLSSSTSHDAQIGQDSNQSEK